MIAITLVEEIEKLRLSREILDFDRFYSIENISIELGKSTNDPIVVNTYLERYFLSGTYIDKKVNSVDAENEVDFLIRNFKLQKFSKLFYDISFLDDVFVIDEGLYAFAEKDSYICYNEESKVLWIDYDTHECLSVIANSHVDFFDSIFELCKNRIDKSLPIEALLKKLININSENSAVFYEYLLM